MKESPLAWVKDKITLMYMLYPQKYNSIYVNLRRRYAQITQLWGKGVYVLSVPSVCCRGYVNLSTHSTTIQRVGSGSTFIDSKIQRFKIALLLPIKHRIIYITVISTWNVNTSTNTAVHYHGSKGCWKSCGIYGLLVCYTISKYISTGVQRVQQKKRKKSNTKWHYQ